MSNRAATWRGVSPKLPLIVAQVQVWGGVILESGQGPEMRLEESPQSVLESGQGPEMRLEESPQSVLESGQGPEMRLEESPQSFPCQPVSFR